MAAFFIVAVRGSRPASLAAILQGMAGKAQPEVGREGSSRAKASRLANHAS